MSNFLQSKFFSYYKDGVTIEIPYHCLNDEIKESLKSLASVLQKNPYIKMGDRDIERSINECLYFDEKHLIKCAEKEEFKKQQKKEMKRREKLLNGEIIEYIWKPTKSISISILGHSIQLYEENNEIIFANNELTPKGYIKKSTQREIEKAFKTNKEWFLKHNLWGDIWKLYQKDLIRDLRIVFTDEYITLHFNQIYQKEYSLGKRNKELYYNLKFIDELPDKYKGNK